MEAVGVSQDDQSSELLAKLDLLLIDYRWDETPQNSIFHIIYLLKSQQILTIILGERTWKAASIILSRRGLIAADCFLLMRRRFWRPVVENHTFPKVFGMQPALPGREKRRRVQAANTAIRRVNRVENSK